jgi:type VI protein secretion system component VasA
MLRVATGLNTRELTGAKMLQLLDVLNIPSDHNNVHYLDVIYRLSQLQFAHHHPSCDWQLVSTLNLPFLSIPNKDNLCFLLG